MDDGRYPQMIVFDLDHTLWDFWIYRSVKPPLRRDATTGVVYDNADEPMRIGFYKDVPEILCGLKSKPDVIVAIASRTSAIKLAREVLQLVTIPSLSAAGKDTTDVPGARTVDPLPAISFFDHLEIYPGSKITHFKQLHQNTGVPYSEMIFFDDESRNTEVASELGVTFVLVTDGMNWDCFQKGLQEWRSRRAADDSAS